MARRQPPDDDEPVAHRRPAARGRGGVGRVRRDAPAVPGPGADAGRTARADPLQRLPDDRRQGEPLMSACSPPCPARSSPGARTACSSSWARPCPTSAAAVRPPGLGWQPPRAPRRPPSARTARRSAGPRTAHATGRRCPVRPFCPDRRNFPPPWGLLPMPEPPRLGYPRRGVLRAVCGHRSTRLPTSPPLGGARRRRARPGTEEHRWVFSRPSASIVVPSRR